MSASYLMTEDEARSFAADWIEAWNSHDLDRIMTHYAEDLVLVSPIAAQLLNDPAGSASLSPAKLMGVWRGLPQTTTIVD